MPKLTTLILTIAILAPLSAHAEPGPKGFGGGGAYGGHGGTVTGHGNYSPAKATHDTIQAAAAKVLSTLPGH